MKTNSQRPERLSQENSAPLLHWAYVLYKAVTCQEADEEIILSKCVFLPLPCRQAHTDKERPLVMLEELCLSSRSGYPSQPEKKVSIALTSTVITLLLSRRRTS